jgi:Uma2 family endonuclease
MSQGTRAKSRSDRRRSGKLIELAIPRSVRLRVSDADFWLLCQENPDLRLERTERGVVEIMPPASGGTGARNVDLTAQLVIWAKRNATGIPFDSSTGFKLPNGATRSPDGSWVRNERWKALTSQEKEEKFAPLCPDFVIELRSRSDKRKKTLQTKMQTFISQGARLGWLIDPSDGTVEVYRPGQTAETRDRPATLSGEDVLPGFVLDLKEILHV